MNNKEVNMTDREVMLNRFNRKNLKKSTGELAKYLGMSRLDYEAAVKRGMDEEAKCLKQKKVESKIEHQIEEKVQSAPLIDPKFIMTGGLYELMNNLAEIHDKDLVRKGV